MGEANHDSLAMICPWSQNNHGIGTRHEITKEILTSGNIKKKLEAKDLLIFFTTLCFWASHCQ